MQEVKSNGRGLASRAMSFRKRNDIAIVWPSPSVNLSSPAPVGRVLRVILSLCLLLLFSTCQQSRPSEEPDNSQLSASDQATVTRAEQYLAQPPVPITSFVSERSQGGIHDFYSEGDYWWPNPEDPEGPYVRRDGKTNPDNFVAHRQVMRQLNQWVATLVAAYILTGDARFADHATDHLTSFFLHPDTRMNPSLHYAQAIKGKVSGRGIGIIDTIHLIEVARAIEVLAATGYLHGTRLTGLKDWFNDYGTWLNTHAYGLDEKDHGNNHSTWWAAQVAAFAHLTDNKQLMRVARSQFKKLLSEQMATDGSFPDELSRTKPYNYTLFNLEGYAVLAQIASSPEENLWYWEAEHGSLHKAWHFMLPFVQDKSTWAYPPDVQYFNDLPIQSPGMLFAARAYEDDQMLAIWQELDPTRNAEEINRTYPIRVPVLWE